MSWGWDQLTCSGPQQQVGQPEALLLLCKQRRCSKPASHLNFEGNQNKSLCHRKRINTEEKPKVVTAVWGMEFIKHSCRASCFELGRFEKRMNCTRMIWRKGWIYFLFFKIVLMQNSLRSKKWNTFCPPNNCDDLCLFFCIYPSSMVSEVC